MDINPLLLQALAGAGSEGLSVKDVLLSQLDETDPTTSLLVKLLAQQPSETIVDESQSEFELELESESDPERLQKEQRARARAAEKAKALRHLRNTIDLLYAELEDLRARNDMLAAALGACYLCWGEDAQCPECGGQGGAGFFTLDRSLFGQFVVPAVHRYKQETANPRSAMNPKATGSRPNSQQTNPIP
ncbi:hypothetical protein C7B76_17280 [filamentous cyanobacterium CCP2]|nr:hypothetical protein C7B76_17280 [filamentous cyanobacterium CCP2]